MSAEIMPGYKQTELGIVPEDWQIQSLPEALQFISGKAHEQFINEAGPYVVVNSKFISTEGGVRKYSSENLCPAKRGDVLMVMSDLPNGRALAKCYLVREDKKYAVNQRVCIFRPTKGSSEYFYYFLNRNKYFMQFDDGVQQTHLLNPIILNCKLKVPPEPEQSRIGQALADIDSLISFLDQLIAKKRDIQQAAMQQLLTGQRRLPGFSGEWHAVKARDIGLFRGGSGFPNRFQGETSGAFPFYKVSDMNNEGNEIFMSTANNYIAEDARKTIGAVIFPTNSIVFAKVGAAVFLERKKILTRPSCLDNNMAAFIVDERRVCVRFMHYALLNTRLGDLVSTTALPSLSNPVLSNIEIILPPVSEQQAIATTLSDIDAELATLEARRDKTRQLKQGMMQELLTGRIRLS